MNVVDSSGWLEYYAEGPNASFFAPPIEDVETLVVPTVSLYEVFKRVYSQRGEDDALIAIAGMLRGSLVVLDANVALSAARISTELKIPMADSIMLASARAFEATLWTQDADFNGIPDVQYVEAAV